MTFVKVRLQLEKMSENEILEIRLRGFEPLRNVPDSVTELGHTIISVEPENAAGSAGIEGETQPAHRVMVKKKEL